MSSKAKVQKKLVAWIENESAASKRVFERLKLELPRLQEKLSHKRVHDSRVALRHFFALWPVLCDDGWDQNDFESTVVKPLERLLKKLGKVRDTDVNIEIAKNELACPNSRIRKWKETRRQYKRKLKKELKSVNVNKLLLRMERFFAEQTTTVSERVADSALGKEETETHVLAALQRQEHVVRALAQQPSTPCEFHKLRLAIKQWRYLLDDLCNSNNMQLEEIQESLGKLHDLDRIKPLLQGDERLITSLANLNSIHQKLLFELFDVEKKLPFGFNPLNQDAKSRTTTRKSSAR